MNGDMKEILKKSIKNVKGVGDARAKLFHKLGIFSIEDLITHFPYDYEDRSNIKKYVSLPRERAVPLRALLCQRSRKEK